MLLHFAKLDLVKMRSFKFRKWIVRIYNVLIQFHEIHIYRTGNKYCDTYRDKTG